METNAETANNVIEEIKRLNKQCYMEDGFIVLKVGYDDYSILFSRIDTAEKILGWSMHLSRKNWVSIELLERFISVASDRIGLEIFI